MPEKRNTDVERGVKLAYFRASGFFSQIVSVSNYGRKIRNLYLYPSPLLLAFAKTRCMNDYSSTAHIDHMTFPVIVQVYFLRQASRQRKMTRNWRLRFLQMFIPFLQTYSSYFNLFHLHDCK